MSKKYSDGFITVAAGPCAAESEEQIYSMARKIGAIGKIASNYNIDVKFRAGAWKPRTLYFERVNGVKKEAYTGSKEQGLAWIADACRQENLPIVSEMMSELDAEQFSSILDPERDYIQIGARHAQTSPLIRKIGQTRFGAVLKNPQHGFKPKEALGSLDLLAKNRETIYCVRGYTMTAPEGEGSPLHKQLIEVMLQDPDQFKEARNFNNIKSIAQIRSDPLIAEHNVAVWYDPSHIFGGKTDTMRLKIGEYAIKAVTDYGYDGIIIEVHDTSKNARSDADQALITTTNGIDWSQTHVGQEPEIMPLTLVGIIKALMHHQVDRKVKIINPQQFEKDYTRIDALRWTGCNLMMQEK